MRLSEETVGLRGDSSIGRHIAVMPDRNTSSAVMHRGEYCGGFRNSELFAALNDNPKTNATKAYGLFGESHAPQ